MARPRTSLTLEPHLTTTLRLSVPTFTALEGVREKMRLKHHRQPPRSAILRGLISGVLAVKGFDFGDALTSDAIAAKVSAQLRRGKA